MRVLTQEKAEKLQKILSKRFGRSLSDIELESAYMALVEFAIILVDLVPEEKNITSINKSQNGNFPLAIRV